MKLAIANQKVEDIFPANQEKTKTSSRALLSITCFPALGASCIVSAFSTGDALTLCAVIGLFLFFFCSEWPKRSASEFKVAFDRIPAV